MIMYQVINPMIKPIFMFNKNMGLYIITNQSKGFFIVTMLLNISFDIWTASWSLDANDLGSFHIVSLRGCGC